MISKGNFHGDGVKLAVYMMRGKAGERADLVEMRGFAAGDLRTAFRDIEIMARDGTNAETAFFHTYVRLPSRERLDTDQWTRTVADRIEKTLGFTGQARAISFHTDIKTGERHMHMAWSRIAQSADGALYAIDPGLYKNKLKQVSRELEHELGLKVVGNERQPGDRARAADRREFEESRRLGTDIKDIRTAILDSFQKSDSGKSFAAAMQARGFELAAGDRRDCFVVVDHEGGQHALNKKLTGKTLAEIRQRLSDLDRSRLPGVEKAQAIQLERKPAREAAQTRELAQAVLTGGKSNTPSHGPEKAAGGDKKPVPELGKTAGEIRLAWSLTRSGQQFADEIERRGLKLVYITAAEADASHRAHAFAKASGRQNRALKEGFGVVDRRGNVTSLAQGPAQRVTGDLWEDIQKRLGGIDKGELASVAEARELMADLNRKEFAAKQQAERDAARPATAVEEKILAAAAAADGDRQKFSAELARDGIALARVTMGDVAALHDLRTDEAITAAADPAHQTRFIPNLVNDLGKLVAVDERGGLHKLNPHHMAALEILAAGSSKAADPHLPGVIEVRSGFEAARQEAVSFQQTMIDTQLARRAEQADARMLAFENRQAEAADRATARELNTAADSAARGVNSVVSGVEKAATAVFEAVAAPLEGIANFLGDFFSAPAPLTRDQAERKIAANAERQAEAADHHAAAAKAQAQDDLIFQQQRDEGDRRAAPEYFRHITRGDDLDRARDHDRGRERER